MTDCINTPTPLTTTTTSNKVLFNGTNTSQVQAGQDLNVFIANVATAFIALQTAINNKTFNPTNVNTTGITSDVIDPTGKTLAEWLTGISGAIKDLQTLTEEIDADSIVYTADYSIIGKENPTNVKEALDSLLQFINDYLREKVLPFIKKIQMPLYPFYVNEFTIEDISAEGINKIRLSYLQAWIKRGYLDVPQSDVTLVDDKDNYVVLNDNKLFETAISIIKNGNLYSGYAVINEAGITSSDEWVVPTKVNWQTLATYVNDSGGKLKSTDERYWEEPNTGATDEFNFNGLGSGNRIEGVFADFTNIGEFLTSTTEDIGFGQIFIDTFALNYNSTTISNSQYPLNFGFSVKLMRTVTANEFLLDDGTYCIPYIGNDGRSYKTVKIGTQVWIVENLAETQYRNGTPISIIEDDAEWLADTTGAMCYYDNDIDNALINSINENTYSVIPVDIDDDEPNTDDSFICMVRVESGVITGTTVFLKTEPVQEDLIADEAIIARHINFSETFEGGFTQNEETKKIGLNVQNSIELFNSIPQLVGDNATPDPLNYYGTNAGRNKGFYSFPYRGTLNENFIQFSNGSREFIDINDSDADARYNGDGAFTFGKRSQEVGHRSFATGFSEAINKGELSNSYDGFVQTSVFSLRADTIDETETHMTNGGDAIVLLNDTINYIKVDMIATNFADSTAAIFETYRFGVSNDNGTLTFTGEVSPSERSPIADFSSFACSYIPIIVDDVLQIRVVGLEDTVLRWGAKISLLTVNNNVEVEA